MTAGEQLSSRRHWDDLHSAGAYAAEPIDTYCSRQLVRIFDRFLQPDPARRLIEIGCALSGYLPLFRQRYGYEVHGLDYSPAGVEATVAGLRRAGVDLGGQIHCLDFQTSVPELHENFDCLASFGVLEHFHGQVEVARKFAELLKPGGLMITEIPNTASRLFGRLKRTDRELFDMHARIDRPGLANIHAQAGLEVLLCQYCGTFNYAVFKPRKYSHLKESLAWYAQKFIWSLSQALRFYPQTRLFSPYIVCVARKPPASK
jgi:SAM-dependent methyltransferase